MELELQEVGQKHHELKEVLWPEGIKKWEVEFPASWRRVRRQLTSALGEKAMGKEASTGFFLLIGGGEREGVVPVPHIGGGRPVLAGPAAAVATSARAHVPRPGAADRWGRRRV